MERRLRSHSVHWAETKSTMDTPSVSKTPVRKSDQWHRLAAVVRSNHQTFVPGSPQHCAISVMRSRAKLVQSGTIHPDVLSDQKPRRASHGLDFAQSTDVQNSPSKIRSLSSSYSSVRSNREKDDGNIGDSGLSKKDIGGSGDPSNVLPKMPENYSFKHNFKSTVSSPKYSNENNTKMFNPYSLQYLIFVGFVIFISFILLLINNEIYSKNDNGKRNLNAHDVSILRKNFKEKLFGQHIAVKIISELTEKLVQNKLSEVSPEKISFANSGLDQSKMAVFSIHGWTGVGKTFSNKILVDSLNPETYVQFIVPIHFPHSINDDIYKTTILHTVTSNVSHSAVNIITFDEMDKASEGVLEGIANAIQQLKFDSAYKDSTIIVLLVSNTHGRDLNQRLFQLLHQGYSRDKLTQADFYTVFWDQVVDVPNGATRKRQWYNVFTERNLIDSFVPFLPLNHLHLEKCVKKSLAMKGLNPTENIVNRVFGDLSLFRPPGSIFQYSHTGCKRVSEKVDLHSEPLF